MKTILTRRALLQKSLTAASAFELGILIHPALGSEALTPRNNPSAHLKLAWTDKLKWDHVVDVTQVAGTGWAERLDRAQKQLQSQGGGVVYFPAGSYVFTDSIYLENSIVLRGAPPNRPGQSSPTQFVFPRFAPSLSGAATAIDTAFKGIFLRARLHNGAQI